MDILSLLEGIAAQYQLDPHGRHGLSHWGRVLENGFKIAQEEGGDRTVITLFAIFHDACRLNEKVDPGHGQRAAVLARQMLLNHPEISRKQLALLVDACRDHTDGKTEAPVTIQACWDADRLDLARVGILPKPAFLCTATARDSEVRAWANQRAKINFTPPFVAEKWAGAFIVP